MERATRTIVVRERAEGLPPGGWIDSLQALIRAGFEVLAGEEHDQAVMEEGRRIAGDHGPVSASGWKVVEREPCGLETMRRQVAGGWLYRLLDVVQEPVATSPALVFVPDPASSGVAQVVAAHREAVTEMTRLAQGSNQAGPPTVPDLQAATDAAELAMLGFNPGPTQERRGLCPVCFRGSCTWHGGQRCSIGGVGPRTRRVIEARLRDQKLQELTAEERADLEATDHQLGEIPHGPGSVTDRGDLLRFRAWAARLLELTHPNLTGVTSQDLRDQLEAAMRKSAKDRSFMAASQSTAGLWRGWARRQVYGCFAPDSIGDGLDDQGLQNLVESARVVFRANSAVLIRRAMELLADAGSHLREESSLLRDVEEWRTKAMAMVSDPEFAELEAGREAVTREDLHAWESWAVSTLTGVGVSAVDLPRRPEGLREAVTARFRTAAKLTHLGDEQARWLTGLRKAIRGEIHDPDLAELASVRALALAVKAYQGAAAPHPVLTGVAADLELLSEVANRIGVEDGDLLAMCVGQESGPPLLGLARRELLDEAVETYGLEVLEGEIVVDHVLGTTARCRYADTDAVRIFVVLPPS
jgi:hypothetical protein